MLFVMAYIGNVSLQALGQQVFVLVCSKTAHCHV